MTLACDLHTKHASIVNKKFPFVLVRRGDEVFFFLHKQLHAIDKSFAMNISRALDARSETLLFGVLMREKLMSECLKKKFTLSTERIVSSAAR